MAEYDKERANERTIQELLGARRDAESLDEIAHQALVAQHQEYIEAHGQSRVLSALAAHRPTMDLLRDSKRRPSLRRALDDVRPPGSKEEPVAEAHHALGHHVQDLQAGCGGRLSTPSYTTGEPLNEVFTDDAIDQTQTFDLSTTSNLAIPDEGKLSLGVGIGNFESWTVHPPAPSVQVPPYLQNVSKGMLTEFIAIPAVYRAERTILTVTVDATIGDVSQPFFFVNATGPERAGVFGEMYLTVYEASSNEEHTEQTTFLNHIADMDGPIVNSVRRSITLSKSLNLNASSSSAFAVIAVRVIAYRYEDSPDRDSFAMVDLRSPDHDTHRIHFVVNNGGPILIPRISATFCPMLEAVR